MAGTLVTDGGAYKELPYPLSSSPWTAGDLIPGHTYKFQLQAVNGAQLGDYSNIATLKIPLPPAPTGLTATASASDPYGAKLSWNPVSGADGYYIYYGTTSAVYDYPTLKRLPYMVTSDHFTAGDLVTPGIQWFAVTAVRYGAEGPQSGLADTAVYMENPLYYGASLWVHGQARTPNDSIWTGNIGSSSRDRGIVLVRLFIAPTDPILLDIGDVPFLTPDPMASGRIQIAWDTRSGALGVHASRSCEQTGIPGVICNSSLPITFGTSPDGDGTPTSYNYIDGTTFSDGSASFAWQGTQSQAASLPLLSQHIDGTGTFACADWINCPVACAQIRLLWRVAGRPVCGTAGRWQSAP